MSQHIALLIPKNKVFICLPRFYVQLEAQYLSVVLQFTFCNPTPAIPLCKYEVSSWLF